MTLKLLFLSIFSFYRDVKYPNDFNYANTLTFKHFRLICRKKFSEKLPSNSTKLEMTIMNPSLIQSTFKEIIEESIKELCFSKKTTVQLRNKKHTYVPQNYVISVLGPRLLEIITHIQFNAVNRLYTWGCRYHNSRKKTKLSNKTSTLSKKKIINTVSSKMDYTQIYDLSNFPCSLSNNVLYDIEKIDLDNEDIEL